MEKRKVLIDFVEWISENIPPSQLLKSEVVVNTYLKSINAEDEIQEEVHKICSHMKLCIEYRCGIEGYKDIICCQSTTGGCKFYEPRNT